MDSFDSEKGLRDGKAFGDPNILQVARKHGKTAAQVTVFQATRHLHRSFVLQDSLTVFEQILGRWCIQKRCVFIPKSVRAERMRENSQIFDFELDAGDNQL